MAINNGAAQANNAQPQQPSSTSVGWSFHDSSVMGTPIPRGVGNEEMTKIKEALIGFFKNANDKLEISVLELSNTEVTSLCYSSIVVTMRDKQNPNTGVAFHTLLLEATGDKPKPVYENINNEQVEVLRVSSDVMDDHYSRAVLNLVRKAFPNGPYLTTEATIIPVTFKVIEPQSVAALASNTGLALWSEINKRNPGFHDMNLATLEKNSSLTMNCAFGRQQLTDAVGAPMRADIIVDLSSKKNGQTGIRASLNSGDRELEISKACGFVDLVWDPVNQQNAFGYQQPVQGPDYKYAARAVITHLHPTTTYTVGGVLLALSNIVAIRDGNNWIQAFRPTQQTDDRVVDITAIGAINIEANVKREIEHNGYGSFLETKGADFKLSHLHQFLTSVVRPGLIVSLDCPEGSPSTHYTSIFTAANSGSQVAYEEIYDSANQLTNGNFERYFPRGTQMFSDQNNRVHLGYYKDHTGVMRDIRDIDYVAVCNLVGLKTPEMIRHFCDTYFNTAIPGLTRMARRKRIIQQLLHENAVFTGFAQRVTFAGKFIDAIGAGIRDTGLSVRVVTPLSGTDFNDQRAVAGFSQMAISNSNQSFLNTGGYSYPGGYNSSMYTNSGRW